LPEQYVNFQEQQQQIKDRRETERERREEKRREEKRRDEKRREEKRREENSLRAMHDPRSFHLEISELDSSCDRHSWKESHATRSHENSLKVRMKTS
jgi:hypothetical protein